MKAKSLTKRAFALALTVVMLVSCWAFSAPTATQASAAAIGSAKHPNTQQNYTIRFYCKCSNDYTPGTQYFTITYRTENGASTSTSTTAAINIPNTDNWFTSWGSSTGYAPSSSGTTVPGFPVSFNVTFNKDSGSGTKGVNKDIRIEILKNGSWTTLMNAGGEASLKGTGNFTQSGSLSDNSAYPQPSGNPSVSFTNSTRTCPATSSTSAVNNPFTTGSTTDQYGVTMYTTLTATASSNSNGLTFNDNNISIAFGANLSGTTNSQTITLTNTIPYRNTSGTVTSKSASASFTLYDATYTATYKYKTTNTSNLASPTENTCTGTYKAYYGDKPSKPTLPATSYYTNAKHWTGGSYTAPTLTSNQTVWPSYTNNDGVAHTCTSQTKTSTYLKTAANCTTGNIYYYKCSGCAYHGTSTFTDTSSALGHIMEEHSQAVTDGGAGMKYFTCTRKGCPDAGKYFGATYVADSNTYTADTTNKQSSIAAVEANTDAENMVAPAPAFNSFTDNTINYAYNTRSASLKVVGDTTFVDEDTTTQSIRFTASIKVPAGVSYNIGGASDNAITDIGFVYTQDRFINGGSDLVIGGTTPTGGYKISKMSLKSKNYSKNGSYNGSNWSGVSVRTDASGNSYLTLNLVIKVYARNWNYQYAARPFIQYRFHGVDYTLYDAGTTNVTGNDRYSFSHNSVAYIATQVVNNPLESIHVRNYCQAKIVDRLPDLPGYVAA